MEAVIFDCDGVLVDSEVIYIDAELDHLAAVGVRFDRATYVRTFMGLSPDEWRARLSDELLARTGRAPDAGFFVTLDAVVTEAFRARLVAMPGAAQAVAALDMVRGVASSTPLDRLTWKLRHTGLLDQFAPHVFSADMVPRGKPAPDLFLHAAAALGVDPLGCVVVEDSANGVRAARAAGMRVIGFTGGGHCLDGHAATLTSSGADVVIDAFADLRAAIDRLSGSPAVRSAAPERTVLLQMEGAARRGRVTAGERPRAGEQQADNGAAMTTTDPTVTTDTYDFSDLRAMYINCTLKRSPELSHTQALADRSIAIMRAHGVEVDVVRAVDHEIATGVWPDMTEHGWERDEWPQLFERVMAADILVLTTPIWLGQTSSVCARVIERLYGNSHLLNPAGQYAYYGRVAGCLVTGNEDGIKHCAMSILYSLQHLGYMIPPQADAGWIGEAGPGPSYADEGSGGPDNDFTNRNTTFMTWNLLHTARMLRAAGGVPAHGNQRSEWDAGCRFDYPNPEHR